MQSSPQRTYRWCRMLGLRAKYSRALQNDMLAQTAIHSAAKCGPWTRRATERCRFLPQRAKSSIALQNATPARKVRQSLTECLPTRRIIRLQLMYARKRLSSSPRWRISDSFAAHVVERTHFAGMAAAAHLAPRKSQNRKVLSSILTCRICLLAPTQSNYAVNQSAAD